MNEKKDISDQIWYLPKKWNLRDRDRVASHNEKVQFQRMINQIREYIDRSFPSEEIDKLEKNVRAKFEKCQDKLKWISKKLDQEVDSYKESLNDLLCCLGEFKDHKWGDDELTRLAGYYDYDMPYNDLSRHRIPVCFQLAVFQLHESMRNITLIGLFSIKNCLEAQSLFMPQHEDILKRFDSLIDMISNIENKSDTNYRELRETYAERKKITPNIQKDLAKWIRSGIAKYCWKNRRAVAEKVENGLKFPGKPTIISMLNKWNKYCHATIEKKKELAEYEPYPKYVDILYGSKKVVEEWAEHVFAPTYIKIKMAMINEKKEKRIKSGKEKKGDAYNRLIVGGTAGAKMMDILENRKAEGGGTDQAFYFDDPPPKKRRYKPE